MFYDYIHIWRRRARVRLDSGEGASFLRCMGIVALGFCATFAQAACTESVTIEELWPRDGGWVHIVAAGKPNMDINNCGKSDWKGLLLNFNDSHGTLEGKKMLYSTLLSAFAANKKLKLCSAACDSQHNVYSTLTGIDSLHQ